MKRSFRCIAALLPLLLLFSVSGRLPAQEPAAADSLRELGLPAHVEDELIAFFNDSATIHFSGRTRIPPERIITGDVAILGGPVTIAGRIDGSIAVINGDVELLPTAEISGNLTVVGGVLEGTSSARVGGELVAYSEALRYRRRGNRIARTGPAPDARGRGMGRSDLVIATGQSYNRVEGLPITFGPVLETAGSNPLRLQALAIYRTENGLTLDTDELGYFVRAEQFLGGHREFRVGATVQDVVSPIEEWHLSDLENGLATFFFRRDFRDHYSRRGWNVFGTYSPMDLPLSLTVRGQWEKHRSRAAGSPWTLFGNADEWRPQPLVAEGELASVLLETEIDTRSDPDDPAWGWLATLEVERSVGMHLEMPQSVQVLSLPAPPEAAPLGEFTTAFIDIRRYNRVSPDGRLNFRLVAGGALTDGPLPPQRQHALGGEGSLPGYRLFDLDCGARSRSVQRRTAATPADGSVDLERPIFFPAYGCDRFGLFQAEYRGRLRFRFDWDADPWDDDGDEEGHGSTGWRTSPDWVLFVDAGRGWTVDRAGSQDIAVDLGLGLALGKLGVFAAIPLNGGSGINVFARLGPRF